MRIAYLLVFLSFLTSVAQQPVNSKTLDAAEGKIPTGTVTGHVYLEDTKAPARKATVYLKPVAVLASDAADDGANRQDKGTTIVVEARFDGSYSFTHVPIGSYYVIAECPGYISPNHMLSLAEARSQYGTFQPLGPMQKAERERVLKSLPRVDVQSALPSVLDVVVERGAAVSGTITYDDGSPAAGLAVHVLARKFENGKETWVSFETAPTYQFRQVLTDDRGNYRISGLPARKYVISVSLSIENNVTYISSSGSGGSTSSYGASPLLTIYSGSTPRQKDASPITIEAGEERNGEDIRIPVSKLHTVRGNVVSAQDGHIINGGQALLLNADDKSMAGASGFAEDDPGFIFYFVYDGEYILSSSMSADVDFIQIQQTENNSGPPGYNSKPLHLYGTASKPLHVDSDMEGVTIAVPEPTAQEAQMMKNLINQQEQQNQIGAPK